MLVFEKSLEPSLILDKFVSSYYSLPWPIMCFCWVTAVKFTKQIFFRICSDWSWTKLEHFTMTTMQEVHLQTFCHLVELYQDKRVFFSLPLQKMLSYWHERRNLFLMVTDWPLIIDTGQYFMQGAKLGPEYFKCCWVNMTPPCNCVRDICLDFNSIFSNLTSPPKYLFFFIFSGSSLHLLRTEMRGLWLQ